VHFGLSIDLQSRCRISRRAPPTFARSVAPARDPALAAEDYMGRRRVPRKAWASGASTRIFTSTDSAARLVADTGAVRDPPRPANTMRPKSRPATSVATHTAVQKIAERADARRRRAKVMRPTWRGAESALSETFLTQRNHLREPSPRGAVF